MMAAEKWQEYQKKYQKYGFDMSPERDSRRERIERRRAAQKSQATEITLKNRFGIGALAIVICGIAIMLIICMASLSAKITYEINEIQAENNALMGEIEDMDVDILSTQSIGYVEKTASNELGMKPASKKKTVYVSSSDVPQKGFGEIVKSKAYE